MTAAALATIEYDVTEIDIARFRQKYVGLTCDTASGYEEVRVALGELRATRTSIEKRRVALKASALEFGRKVDKAAKDLTTLVEAIEAPLKAQKDAVDEARENAKKAAEKAEMLALQAKIKADQEAEDARLKAERDRLAAERAANDAAAATERERQKAEQAKLDAQRAEVEAAQRAIAEQQAAAARVEADRVAVAQAEAEAKVAAERARAEAARLEAMRPDVEKVRGWADAIRAFAAAPPEVEAPEALRAIAWVQGRLADLADKVSTFGGAS